MGRASRTALLSVRRLTADYGSRRALSGVDLDVFEGEVVALAGENGAGKSTLVRCVAGDLAATEGEIFIDDERVRADPATVARKGVSVVWQDLALCENLNVAANLLLGREARAELRSDARFHSTARALLASLDIPLPDTTAPVSSLSGGQRQLLAVARAMRDRPRLLILDEPTASLGLFESAQVESLTRRLSDEGTTILLVSHDIDQMFRLADRIAVLRHGRIVADVPTATGHPDEVVALMSGQPVDSSPRRQLDRLHSLVGRLTSGDPESSLAVILSALGTALAADRLCIHLLDDDRLRLTASVGMPASLHAAWAELPCAVDGGPPGAAALTQSTVIDADVREAHAWRPFRDIAERAGIRSSWAVPVTSGGGLLGVITVFRRNRGTPHRDELDLVTLYAGYAASAAERDRLLGEVTARNRVLETIRVVLEELAVSVPLADGLGIAVDTLRNGLGAETVALMGRHPDGSPWCRGWSSVAASEFEPRAELLAAIDSVAVVDGAPPVLALNRDTSQLLAIHVPAPDWPLALIAMWPPGEPGRAAVPFSDAPALLEDAARSLQLALERETSERAHREAAALRRSQDLQQAFLSRLSHELRTPLTAIHGYADSLLQTDVEWDAESTARFLSRIASESARLSRLVGDLLDLSAIESNILRLHRDWCDVVLVIDAARACAPMSEVDRIKVDCEPLPSIWADHDRLEQVFVNLIDNAIRHNPPTTMVLVSARPLGTDRILVTVADDGVGILGTSADRAQDVPRTSTSGAGLGLSISRAIVTAHGGNLQLDSSEFGPGAAGTCWRIELPVSGGDPALTPTVVAAVDD
jgi:ABC-type multidrug transport system ATPase subunit/signal transduction histidine kinase